jgi:hypothetical protein
LALFFVEGGRRDQRRIDDRPFAQDQALLGQMGVDRLEDLARKPVGFEQPSELQQSGRIRRRLPRQVNPHEAADRLTVVQRVLHPLVGQPEALLGHVHAQHPRQANRRAPPALALRVERLDLRLQRRPRALTAWIPARKRSRRVSFFLAAYSRSEKLDCIGQGLVRGGDQRDYLA